MKALAFTFLVFLFQFLSACTRIVCAEAETSKMRGTWKIAIIEAEGEFDSELLASLAEQNLIFGENNYELRKSSGMIWESGEYIFLLQSSTLKLLAKQGDVLKFNSDCQVLWMSQSSVEVKHTYSPNKYLILKLSRVH